MSYPTVQAPEEQLADTRLAEQRHQLETPALEDAFAHLAIDHPDRCGQQQDGGQP